jgi:hypothetical protein
MAGTMGLRLGLSHICDARLAALPRHAENRSNGDLCQQ